MAHLFGACSDGIWWNHRGNRIDDIRRIVGYDLDAQQTHFSLRITAMSQMFSDRLLEAIEKKGSPICVGIDPVYESIPAAVAGPQVDRDFNDPEAAIDAIFSFTTTVLKTIAPHVPVVKFQSAYFEKYLWEGVETYYSLIQEAKDLGLLVIGDVKRGDIGSTSAAYANAHLAESQFPDAENIMPDAITINPMLGLDSIEPFVKVCREEGKGLFVLVRTSNPGSADFQDVKLIDGRTWSELVADKLNTCAQDPALIGTHGFSNIGAVVGATQTHTMESLRKRLPRSIFLLPGYGTQGATAEMTKAAFLNGSGAIVSASRSILYAHRDPKYSAMKDWAAAVLQATLDMKADLAKV
jgi:orotidine-5'-phosphate decarboxylase